VLVVVAAVLTMKQTTAAVALVELAVVVMVGT
jgi:hypothetical protein